MSLVQRVTFIDKRGFTYVKETSKTVTLFTYMTLQRTIGYQKFDYKHDHSIAPANSDLFRPMRTINWRLRRNLSAACIVCGTRENVEMHHAKAIRTGKVVGFSQVMRSLNRKTVPLCKIHHRMAHEGKLDGLSFDDLYNVEFFLL